MAKSTGPILAAGAITAFNKAIIMNQVAGTAQILVGTALAAGGLVLVERLNEKLAYGLSWLVLVTVLLVRVDPNTPAPAEQFNKWYNAK